MGGRGALISQEGIRRQPADSQSQTNASLQNMMMAMAEKEVSPAQPSTAESVIALVQRKAAGTEGTQKDFTRTLRQHCTSAGLQVKEEQIYVTKQGKDKHVLIRISISNFFILYLK